MAAARKKKTKLLLLLQSVRELKGGVLGTQHTKSVCLFEHFVLQLATLSDRTTAFNEALPGTAKNKQQEFS